MPSSDGMEAAPPPRLPKSTIFFAVALLPLGWFSCYWGASWAAFISSPTGQLSARQSASVIELEVIGLALVVAGVGVLLVRRCAWFLAILILHYGLTRWLIVGIGTMIFGTHDASAERWTGMVVKGAIIPAVLSPLLVFLLASASNRQRFAVQRVSVPPLIVISAATALLFTWLWHLIPPMEQS